MKKSLLRTATFTPRTTHNYVRGGVLVCIALLTTAIFTSCENFLKAQDVANQIKKKIEYNNTEPYAIYVDAQKDTGIITKPAGGETDVRPTDTFILSFNCDTSYQFIKWQVYDSATGENIDDDTYLKIEDPQQIDTTCTFLKIPDDPNIELAVYAVVAKRPQIFLSRPNDLVTGAPAYSDIEVFFDQFNMDPDNIYYTQEEMQELKESQNLQDSDFLQGDETLCGGRYYGYQKEGNKYFKNIQIVNYEDPKQNMAKYFCDPYWAKEPNTVGGSTLIIQTSIIPPPLKETLYVTLSENFCYRMDGIQVKLPETKAWSYKIAENANDKIPPEFILPRTAGNAEIYAIFKVMVDNEYKTVPNSIGSRIPSNPFTVSGNIKMSFYFTATDDGGSGIANRFRLYYDPDPIDSPSTTQFIELPYPNKTKNRASTEWSDEYLVQRPSFLPTDKNSVFTIYVIDNDGNKTQLKYTNGEPYVFVLKWTN